MKTALHDKLEKVANILEKTAVYLDTIETKEVNDTKAKISEEYITPVAEKMAESIGDELDNDMKEKLANSDPAVLALVKKLALKPSIEKSSALGGPSEEIKPTTTKEDSDPLLDFCLS